MDFSKLNANAQAAKSEGKTSTSNGGGKSKMRPGVYDVEIDRAGIETYQSGKEGLTVVYTVGQVVELDEAIPSEEQEKLVGMKIKHRFVFGVDFIEREVLPLYLSDAGIDLSTIKSKGGMLDAVEELKGLRLKIKSVAQKSGNGFNHYVQEWYTTLGGESNAPEEAPVEEAPAEAKSNGVW